VLSTTLNATLDRLEELRRRFSMRDSVRAEKTLSQLARRRFPNAASLIRFHEALLFMRAYPHSPSIVQKAEDLLASFHQRVEQLIASDTKDLSALFEPEVSGIAGTFLTAIWSYDIVRHLAARHSSKVEIDWEGYEAEPLLVPILKKLFPLFEDAAYAEYPVPYLKWVRAAKRRNERDLTWLLRRFEQLPISDKDRADLFDALKLWVHWELGNSRATRTRMRWRESKVFYHDRPLLSRSEVSLAQVLEESSKLPLQKLARAEGEKLLCLGRDTMTVRFRELYGFTHGDARHVLCAAVGRGVEFFIWGVPPALRLPLLAYHAVFILKNGVPIGYAESLALFERSEVGLNLFYTFRDGESAWIYAQLLRLLRQYLGIRVFSIDPYQIGFNNEEGIESGAFWFYRKLGFRPIRPKLAKMVLHEERKVATIPGYRTPARILRQIAAGHILYETPSSSRSGEWDHFHIGHIGLAIQRRMAKLPASDEQKIRRVSAAKVAREIGIRVANRNASEHRVFYNLALVLALIPDLSRWSKKEKREIAGLVRAKAGKEESEYLRLLQRHLRLRDELITIGSKRGYSPMP